MNGKPYQKERYFESQSRINNTWSRNNSIHYNNRYEFRRQPNSWKRWHPKPRSQETSLPFHRRSYIFNQPTNLIVTVPNFSRVRPPKVFAFRSTSDKSVRIAPTPASEPPQSSLSMPANEERGTDLMEPNETGAEDDVQYLYTVQTNGGELVEFVDLSEDVKNQNCSVTFSNSDPLLQSNSISSSDAKDSDTDIMILEVPEETAPRSAKQNAGRGKARKRKVACEDLLCGICGTEYTFVRSKGQEIFKARCGHMFCEQCLKVLDPYECPECNLHLQKLFKVFL